MSSGTEVEDGFNALGGVWLRFFYQPHVHGRVGHEVVRAK